MKQRLHHPNTFHVHRSGEDERGERRQTHFVVEGHRLLHLGRLVELAVGKNIGCEEVDQNGSECEERERCRACEQQGEKIELPD